MLEERLLKDEAFSNSYLLLKEIYQSGTDYIHPESHSTESALSEFKIRVQGERTIRPMRLYYAIAASFAILALAGLGLFNVIQNREFVTVAAQDKMKLIELQDGSSLLLNPGAEIRYNPQTLQKKREITAYGDITFLIRKSKKYPFTIKLKDADILVTGTRFRIQQNPGIKTISLFSGKLQVTSKNKTYVLKSGESLSGSENLVKSENLLPDNSTSIYSLDFNNKPLSEIIKHVEKRFDIIIEYPQHLKNQRFTMNAEGLSQNEVLLILTELTSTTVEEHSGYLELKQ